MTEPITGCVCPNAGFCERHGIKKNPHFHQLCQNHIGYWQMWEECRGVGQEFTDCNKRSQEAPIPPAAPPSPCRTCGNVRQPTQEELKASLPSTWQQTKNLAVATAEHIANGMKTVPVDLKSQRLAICEQCPFYLKDSSRCSKCGCNLQVKAAWESSKCPVGNW